MKKICGPRDSDSEPKLSAKGGGVGGKPKSKVSLSTSCLVEEGVSLITTCGITA